MTLQEALNERMIETARWVAWHNALATHSPQATVRELNADEARDMANVLSELRRVAIMAGAHWTDLDALEDQGRQLAREMLQRETFGAKTVTA